MSKGLRYIALISVCFLGLSALASGPALLRVERRTAEDRPFLTRSGVPLVAEFESFLLVLDEPDRAREVLAGLGYEAQVLERDTSGWAYFSAHPRPGAEAADLASCGQVIWTEGGEVLLRTMGDLPEPCSGSSRWFMSPLRLEPLPLPVPPPVEFAALREGAETITPKPIVQTIVNGISSGTILGCWDDIINAASTRYSTSAGCSAATTSVYNKFAALGLNPYYQNHTSGHAPNVIGVLPGQITPEKVYIVVGHIDDMPSSGPAPGADDNASGTVAATAAAQVLAPYTFASTIKFIAVTGEEFGLYGSEYYANNAQSEGEQIQAVLNADMIGWAGNGVPTSGENLDLNYNSSSQWLGTLFYDCATQYGTGCPVDAFLCPSLSASDHYPFWQNGFSAVCGITDNEGYCSHSGSYPYYHTSNDTKANCGNTAFFVSAVKAYIATLAHMADPLCGIPFPSPPATLAAQAAGANTINLSWNSAIGATSYQVYRAPGGCAGAFPQTKVGETAGTSYADATASGGVPYAYTVRAKKDFCLSDPSPCAEATTTGSCSEPPSFAGLSAVTNAAISSCTLSLSWSAGAAWCGGSLTYNIYRSTSSPFAPSPSNRIATGISGTSYMDNGSLVYGTTYYYIVRAVDGSTGVEEANTVAVDGSPTGPITIGTWTDDAGDAGVAKLTPSSPWSVAASGGHTAPKVYQTGTYTDDLCAPLTGPPMILGEGSQLTFWSKYDIESGWDKGQVEVSQDGGATWQRVPVNYPVNATHTGDECGFPTGYYFTGTNLTWASYTGSLAAWANEGVILRWRISSDGSQTGTGWWVDDISITNVQVPGSCTTGGGGCTLTCSATVPAAGAPNVAVSFQSTSAPVGCSGTPSYSWTFGDGGTSFLQNPTHTYAAAGTFNWTLTVIVDGVPCTQYGSITISAGCVLTCTASANPSAGVPPLAVNFSASATPVNCPGVVTYSWTFGDGGTSTLQNPSHTYTVAGVFHWSLTATIGSVTCVKTGTVTASAPCSATCTASASPNMGQAPLAVTFRATLTAPDCTGAPAYSWTFGDGATSAQQNASHTYAAAGTYTWTFTVQVDAETCTKTGTVLVSGPCSLSCSATAGPSSGVMPLAVAFGATASYPGCQGSPTFSWSFGDGFTSSLQNPTHTYALPGSYTWWLSVRVEGQICSRSGTVTVTEPCSLSCEVTAAISGTKAPIIVDFQATATAPNCPGEPVYSWSFGDGQTSSLRSPTHVYQTPGVYSWRLTVKQAGLVCSRMGTVRVPSLQTGATPQPRNEGAE